MTSKLVSRGFTPVTAAKQAGHMPDVHCQCRQIAITKEAAVGKRIAVWWANDEEVCPSSPCHRALLSQRFCA